MSRAAPGPRPRVLIVGPVTADVFDDRVAMGGAVTFAARTATAFGLRAQVLTAARPGFDRSVFEGHDLHVVDTDATLAFRHRTVDGKRQLRVIDDAGWTLSPLDLPPAWPAADVLVLAPLLPDDVDVASFLRLAGPQYRAVLAQGLLRNVGGFGEVRRSEQPAEVLAGLGKGASVFVSDDDLGDASPMAIATTLRELIVTHGAEGVEVLWDGGSQHIDAATVTSVVDDTGAGDVFASAYAFALTCGAARDRLEAAAIAGIYAAEKVQRMGTAPLPALEDILSRLDTVATAVVADPAPVAAAVVDDVENAPAEPGITRPAAEGNRARLGRVVAFANQKGGVGKTTSTVSVGAALANLGMRVLVIDADPQANATSAVGQRRAGALGLYEALVDGTPLQPALVETDTPRLWVLPGSPELAGVEIELVDQEQREYRMRVALLPLRSEFDFIFVDCPPSLGLLTVNALAAADEVIIPVQAEYLALEGLGHLSATIERVRASLNPQLTIRGVLLTMFDARTNLARQVEAEVRRHFPQTFRASVPRSIRLSEAPSHGEPIQQYDPASSGAAAYNAVAAELLEQLQAEISGAGAMAADADERIVDAS